MNPCRTMLIQRHLYHDRKEENEFISVANQLEQQQQIVNGPYYRKRNVK